MNEKAKNTSSEESSADENLVITESKQIFAKYQIQVVDHELGPRVENIKYFEPNPSHFHLGMQALEYKCYADEPYFSKESLMQVLCCCCLPCLYIHYYALAMFSSCSNMISGHLKLMESKYTFEYCCCGILGRFEQ